MGAKKVLALPCPFCGKQPETGVSIKYTTLTSEYGYAGCLNTQCHVRPRVASVMGIGEGEQSAIRRWNVRN